VDAICNKVEIGHTNCVMWTKLRMYQLELCLVSGMLGDVNRMELRTKNGRRADLEEN